MPVPKRKPTAEAARQPAPTASAAPTPAIKTPRAHFKLAAIVAELRDPDGATIADNRPYKEHVGKIV
jgi:hypothetical protein